ncbi:helix-turn-helix domain-containing protein [Cupriavidus sp. DF5525]|uniref:AraC family transcriptional regulator n=1 Tax=Cupriavidus sp. DF5525 TaxID=3160989 RepID=UPI0032DF2A04
MHISRCSHAATPDALPGILWCVAPRVLHGGLPKAADYCTTGMVGRAPCPLARAGNEWRKPRDNIALPTPQPPPTTIMLDTKNLLHGIDLVLDLALMEQVFDRLPNVLFYVKDKEARYLMVNATLVERSALVSKEDVIGKTADELFEVTGSSTLMQDLSVIRSGEPITDVLRLFFSADGHRQWCLSSKFPVRDAEGQIAGLLGISRILPRPDEKHASYKRLLQFLKRLEEPAQPNLRISEIAREVQLSLDTLERLCREVFGLTPKQIMMRMRLDRACRLLETTDASITDIAAECGYADHSAFSRQFKAATLCTPQQYRGAHRTS